MRALAKTGWIVMTILSIGVAGYALFHVVTGFAFLPIKNPMFEPWGLRTHVAISGIALLTGPFQFSAGIRRTRPKLHRFMGRIYIIACLIGGVAGTTVALGSTAGPVAGWGFFLLGVLWLVSTLNAYFAARARNFSAHEAWMMRSFALTLAAVTLRIYLGLAAATTGIPAMYPLIAWACWVPNFLIIEAWLRFTNHPGLAPKVRAARPAA
jgi:uncharacterized membrane protein